MLPTSVEWKNAAQLHNLFYALSRSASRITKNVHEWLYPTRREWATVGVGQLGSPGQQPTQVVAGYKLGKKSQSRLAFVRFWCVKSVAAVSAHTKELVIRGRGLSGLGLNPCTDKTTLFWTVPPRPNVALIIVRSSHTKLTTKTALMIKFALMWIANQLSTVMAWVGLA